MGRNQKGGQKVNSDGRQIPKLLNFVTLEKLARFSTSTLFSALKL